MALPDITALTERRKRHDRPQTATINKNSAVGPRCIG